MNETNYLDPQSFETMVKVFPLITDYNTFKKTNPDGIPDPKELKILARIEYCCALRVSEALSLRPEDFDIENRILTLNHTKTGYKKCSKCKGKGEDCTKCDGKGKIQKKQYTSIPPDLIPHTQEWLKTKPLGEKIFPYNRQLVWSYYKKAGKFAQLKIAEQQDERFIKGVWTHLLRKSRSKLMKYLGANRELRMLKLRHAPKDAHDRYDNEDIHSLIKWESENL